MATAPDQPARAPTGAPPTGAAAEAPRYDWREYARTPSALPLGPDEQPATAAEIGGAVALSRQERRQAAAAGPAEGAGEEPMGERFTADELADLVRAYRAYTPPAPQPAPVTAAGAAGAAARRQRQAEDLAQRTGGRS